MNDPQDNEKENKLFILALFQGVLVFVLLFIDSRTINAAESISGLGMDRMAAYALMAMVASAVLVATDIVIFKYRGKFILKFLAWLTSVVVVGLVPLVLLLAYTCFALLFKWPLL